MKNKVKFRKSLKKNSILYLFLLPMIIYVFIFNYMPLAGLQIAFKDFVATKGIWGSEWVGFKYFRQFFTSPMFWKLLKNTLVISLYQLVFSFPIPIILALILNYTPSQRLKKITQTATYAPHFISTVVLVGMMFVFFDPASGIGTSILKGFGMNNPQVLTDPAAFPHLYVWSAIWQTTGWSSIIYIAALSGVSPELHEAAIADGANKLQVFGRVVLPIVAPGLVAVAIYTFINAWNEFLYSLILMNSSEKMTVAVALKSLEGQEVLDWGVMMAASAMVVIPSVIFFMLIQKKIAGGLAQGSIK